MWLESKQKEEKGTKCIMGPQHSYWPSQQEHTLGECVGPRLGDELEIEGLTVPFSIDGKLLMMPCPLTHPHTITISGSCVLVCVCVCVLNKTKHLFNMRVTMSVIFFIKSKSELAGSDKFSIFYSFMSDML